MEKSVRALLLALLLATLGVIGVTACADDGNEGGAVPTAIDERTRNERPSGSHGLSNN